MRGRVEGGWGTNECEKWKVASRVKYNTCLSVCVLSYIEVGYSGTDAAADGG